MIAPAEERRGSPALHDVVVDLILRAPFFGHVLAGLDKRVVPGDGAHVEVRGPRYVVLIGEDLLARATPAQARGILKHELLHLLLEHPARRRERPDRARFDLAADLVVGPLLDEDERGPWDTLPGDRPDLDLPAEATVDEYYRLLPPSPVAPVEARSHAGWDDLEQGTEAEVLLRQATLRELVEGALTRSARHGRVPGALLRLLAELRARREAVSWRTVVRRFRATADTTRVVSTIHRASPRYGTVPGTKIRRLCRLVAVIDTSGSVDAEDLAAFSSELGHLARTGCDVWLVYCDAIVQGQEPFTGTLPARVPGGGGTAFDPGLRAAAARDPDGIVYLTDGFADRVTVRPRCPLLWVLTPGGRDPASADTRALLPGRVVRMPPA